MAEAGQALAGKVALVTGGTHSIGEAICRRLHRAGARVLVTGIEDAAGEALARDLNSGGTSADALYRHLDVRSDAEIEAALEDCQAAFGRLDILVNCACSYRDRGPASSREDWLETLNVNVVGPAMLVQKAGALLTKPGGVVVNIGSISGKVGSRERGPYAAGKAALMHFTKLAAAALGPEGVRVVSVSPGWTWSPPMEAMTRGRRDIADAAGGRVNPLGRVGRMEEVANVVAFVASEEAGWVNGCDIAVDGGFTALGPDQGLGPKHWCDAAVLKDEDALP
ncbi:SDR family oxidoreductase [Breoghania sp. JC706]|uniref:SDR family oxidoreductase n=1 Tax=Breoghania sp. JC706 TaxID=3117732 RepID=UPI0030087084